MLENESSCISFLTSLISNSDWLLKACLFFPRFWQEWCQYLDKVTVWTGISFPSVQMLHWGEQAIYSQEQQKKSTGLHWELFLRYSNWTPHQMPFSQVKMDQTVMVEDLLLIMFKSQQASPLRRMVCSTLPPKQPTAYPGSKGVNLHERTAGPTNLSTPAAGLGPKGHTQQQNPSHTLPAWRLKNKTQWDKILCFNKSDSSPEADIWLLIMTQTGDTLPEQALSLPKVYTGNHKWKH